jgi:hypothetical protein
MNERDPMTRLLGAEGEDAGCEGALAVLDEYVEAELEGRPVADLWPAAAAHIRSCPACSEDHDGLLVLIREERGG